MNTEFLRALAEFSVFLPAAVLCYLPMKNQMRFPAMKTFPIIGILLCLVIVVGASFKTLFGTDANTVMLPLLVLVFIFYHHSLKIDIARSLAVFIIGCAVSAFPSNFAYAFDAYLHPSAVYTDFSIEAAFMQFAITAALTLFFAYPLRKWGSKLLDNLIIPHIWIAITTISAVFLMLCIALVPHNYSTLQVGHCFPIYIAILFVLLLFMIILYVGFYHIAMGIFKNAELTRRIEFFELQEKQYRTQQKYIEETSRERHDFRQSIFTIKKLAENGDFESLENYLREYSEHAPETEIKRYCSNSALNALLNYYAVTAAKCDIDTKWDIELPENISVADPDLCTLVGNLIENAIAGCQTLETGRYHQLSVTVRNDVNLYIVSTNSFDGNVKIKDGHYQSLKHSYGIGINSIEMTAEKYRGSTRFHHEGNEFYADVMLTVNSDYETSDLRKH